MNIHMPIQTKPNPPMTMNAISQPLPTPMLWKYRAKEGMVTGAIKAPTVAPALKMEVENARSFFREILGGDFNCCGEVSGFTDTQYHTGSDEKVNTGNGNSRCYGACCRNHGCGVMNAHYMFGCHPQTACRQAPNDHTKIAQR